MAVGESRSADGSSHGRAVFVATAGVDIGSTIAAGLAASGAGVAWITDAAEPPIMPLPSSVARIHASFASRGGLGARVRRSERTRGSADQVVHSAMPVAALEPEDIVSMSDERWSTSCRAAMSATLYCLQAAFTLMNQRGGSVVVIGPSLSLAGAPRLVALSAAIEGQRGLAKSTARQWGRLGLTVNWIAAAPKALSPLFAKVAAPGQARSCAGRIWTAARSRNPKSCR